MPWIREYSSAVNMSANQVEIVIKRKVMNQREIKFRAWDKNRGFMESHENFIKNVWSYREVVSGLDDTHILQQYTGLKDIHGKEIYEGDIVVAIVKNGEGRPVRSRRLTKVVRWGVHNKRHVGFNVGEGSYEIIGNIYENPELIPKE